MSVRLSGTRPLLLKNSSRDLFKIRAVYLLIIEKHQHTANSSTRPLIAFPTHDALLQGSHGGGAQEAWPPGERSFSLLVDFALSQEQGGAFPSLALQNGQEVIDLL